MNAIQACEKFWCNAAELDAAWQEAKVTKFGDIFYCGLAAINGDSLYVFNAFFMVMRSKFVGADNKMHSFEVQRESEKLS